MIAAAGENGHSPKLQKTRSIIRFTGYLQLFCDTCAGASNQNPQNKHSTADCTDIFIYILIDSLLPAYNSANAADASRA